MWAIAQAYVSSATVVSAMWLDTLTKMVASKFRLKSMKLSALMLAGTMALAACGGSDDEAAEHDHSSHDHEMVSDIEGMGSMGDPDATPAAEVADADLTSVEFQLLDTRPDGFDDAAGLADLARHDDGTTVTLTLDGLDPGRQYIAHVHAGTCAENGGPHYKFDPDGSDAPPNEIHLSFKSDSDGNGFMTAENAQVVGDDAGSIVVHATDAMQALIACAPLS